MEYLMDLKDLLCAELEEYAEKGMKSGKMSAADLDGIHKLTDTVKNIMKINVLAEEMGEEGGSSYGGYSEEGGSSYARGGGRGRGRNARRDSMGRYSREGGYSEEGGSSYRRGGGSSYRGGSSYEGGQGGQGGMRGGRGGGGGGSSYRGGGGSSYASSREGGYSREGAKDYMMDKIEEMMDEAENPKQREALQRCMQALERA